MMKTLYYALMMSVLMPAASALAQQAAPQPQTAVPDAQMLAPVPVPAPVVTVDPDLAALQQQWAVIKYQTADKQAQEKAIAELATIADAMVQSKPGQAEFLIWKGIILATKAGIDGGLGALGDAKDARDALLAAEKINPNALDGSVYTSLGSLYYKVPAWPVGFGDDEKAKAYLEKAMSINPHGIDPNYFYGDYLFEQGDYTGAKTALERALAAPARPGRELADKGRVEEIRSLLSQIAEKTGS